MESRGLAAAAVTVAAIFLLIYLPDIGHGFVQDDFRWIVENRVDTLADVAAVFQRNVGFYRPIVSLSFALDHALWGTNAFGYAVTNVVLCLVASVILYGVVKRLGLPRVAALVAASVWLLNFHAVNMAVLWLSGRTALLATVFTLLTAHAALVGRVVIAGVFTLLAVLSKEETIVLPALASVAVYLQTRRWELVAKSLPMWVAVGVYLALRAQSGAFWPGTAPSYYQFTFSPTLVARNVGEYADRAGTMALVVALSFALGTGVRRRALDVREKRAALLGALWIPAMFAVTVFLPVRSSLYALLPSIGSALIAAAIAAAAVRNNLRAFSRVAVVLLTAAAMSTPVYRSRNARWVRPAELSERVLTTIARDASGRVSGRVALIDDPGQRFNFQAAFGSLFPEALRLRVGEQWSGTIVKPDDASGPADLTYQLVDGMLTRRP